MHALHLILLGLAVYSAGVVSGIVIWAAWPTRRTAPSK